MEEALDVIIRLFTKSNVYLRDDWLPCATPAPAAALHKAYPKIAVAAVQSPAGMRLAGKHGAGILLALPRGESAKRLKEYWAIAEESALSTARRWTETNGESSSTATCRDAGAAIAETRIKAGNYSRGYFTETLSTTPNPNPPG